MKKPIEVGGPYGSFAYKFIQKDKQAVEQSVSE